MNAQKSRHAPSAHRFDFAVTLSVIGILATLLLHYLNETQNDIEQVIVKTELNNLRLGLAETWVHKNVTHQPIEIKALNDSNPMLLVISRPQNYIGERSGAPSSGKEIWYFDTTKKRLIYLSNDGHQTQYRFISTVGQAKASLLTIGGMDLVKDIDLVKDKLEQLNDLKIFNIF